MAEWQERTIGDLVTLQRGIDLPEGRRIDGQVPIMGSFGITGRHNAPACKGPGVTVGRSGASIGVISYVAEDYWPLNTCLYVKDFKGNNPRFAYYFLKTFDLSRLNSGSAQPSLNRNFVHPVPARFPNRDEQDAIAFLLGSLDDKIELNRRMNETLEAIARAIFKDWYLRNIDDLRRTTVSDAIASGTMVIGDGYRAKNSEMGMPGLPFIRAGELNNGFDVQGAEVLHERSVSAVGEKLSRPGDIAFTSKGTIGRFARVSNHTPKFVYSPQVCFWRSTDSARLRPAILYTWMVSEDLKGQIDAVAGQTDMAPYVSLRDQRAMTIPVFGIGQHVVADSIDPLLQLQDANLAESRSLAQTRDLLLPKLMSGEVRIREAEKAIEAAA